MVFAQRLHSQHNASGAEMRAATASDGPTPPQEEQQQTSLYASYLARDLKTYSADFEDSLIDAVLNSSGRFIGRDGVRIIPEDSDEQPVEGVSLRAEDVSLESLPSIPSSEAEPPLPLNHPRRVFASPVAGVKLTHPGGFLEGGPGLDPERDTFPDHFFARNPQITTSIQLQATLKHEVDGSIELLKERLQNRRRAKERNEQIEKELRMLTDQHSMELRVQERMQEDARKKKEARELRRKERDGG